MKKYINNNRGITLISLIITVILLIILASVATYSGVDTVKYSKFTAFTAEMKIMQVKVNELYQELESGNKEVLNLGKPLNGVEEKSFKALNITDKTGYKYFDKETIKGLNIEGVKEEYIVNIEKRKVISIKGAKYDNKIYYTLDDLPNGLYNVEYKGQDSSTTPTFKVNKERIEKGKWKIKISDINYNGNIKKWYVKYQKQGESNWNTTEDMEFIVEGSGNYNIKITNDFGKNKIESLQQSIFIEKEYIEDKLIMRLDAIENTKQGHNSNTTIWEDLSEHNNNGVLKNFSKTNDSGWKDNSLKFDGSDDIVEINGGFSKYKSGVPFTYSATFKTKDVSSNWYGVMSNMNAWGKGGFNIQYGAAQKIALGMGTYINSTTIPKANTVYSVQGVYDGNQISLYVNGKKETSYTYNITPGDAVMKIGCFYTVPSLLTNGEIYNILFYDKALNDNEIKENYNIDKQRFNF